MKILYSVLIAIGTLALAGIFLVVAIGCWLVREIGAIVRAVPLDA